MFPEEFISYTKPLFGDERWQRYVDSFDDDIPVSIRLNPFKSIEGSYDFEIAKPVKWCKDAFYLQKRHNFTLDPLLHAGAYYVQEASSMFLDVVLRQYVGGKVDMLDLCAAPGGKSTLARAALVEGSKLMTNEPDHRRANILMENIQKQGHPDVVVTNNYAIDYQRSKLMFDVILCDVPCSGEGMFRKDRGAIDQWSLANVMKCAALQREIVKDIWPCLRTGGILIYSTCTFNLHEDEENVRWIKEELGAEILPVSTEDDWGITGSLLAGFDEPVYRFIPGTTQGEGLFIAVLRKTSDECVSGKAKKPCLRVLSDGNPQPTMKGKTEIPNHAEALLTTLDKAKYPFAELDLETALQYLRHEAIVLPSETPRGYVIVTYRGLPLGFVKNLGNRANNLYPQEWKIRNL